MSKLKYKNPAKFTEIGWKRFLTKVHKEVDGKRLYRFMEDYRHERIDCFNKGPAHATKLWDKDNDTTLYRAGIELNGSRYVIDDYESRGRTMELYAIVASEFVPVSKVPGSDVDGDTALVVYM